MKKDLPEILAPAGTPDAAWAALAYGADAVYAGLPQFSARAEAGNFTAEALDELIGYAHHLGRQIYIPFNTLVQQHELPTALETLALIRDLNANAVIVQDMGIIQLAKANFPELRLHASTQLAVHNLDGAQQLAELGFKRVVLARELSLDAIANISHNAGLETEAFIHGALCYSYSGLCLFSSQQIGRSGNRGRCAYNCRQKFTSAEGTSLPFSMKDFSAADHLPELLAAGVTSLKIEGRMKSPAYVAAVTDYYRRLTDGGLSKAEQAQLLSDIQTIFGRPSTDLYLNDPTTDPIEPVNAGHHGALIGTVKEIRPGGWLIFKSNRALRKYDGLKVETPGNTFAYGFAAHDLRLASESESTRSFDLPADKTIAIRLPHDAPHLEPGTPIYCSISQEIRQRYDFQTPRPGTYRQRRPIDIQVFQTLEKTVFTASSGGIQTDLTLDGPFEPAKQPEKAAAALQKCFDKLGETDWKLRTLTIDETSAPVFVPMSILNDARRRLIDQFSTVWAQNRVQAQPASNAWEKSEPSSSISWSVKSRVFQPLEGINEFVLEMDPERPEEIENALAFYGDRLRLALPVIIRDDDTHVFKTLIEKYASIEKWEAANIGALHLLAGKKNLSADWPLYSMNTQAAQGWKQQRCNQLVLSPEDDASNLTALIEELGEAAVVMVYQHTPLMISASKPSAGGSDLTDRSRQAFHVEPAGKEFILTADTPFSLVAHLNELKTAGARRFRIDLTYSTHSLEEAADLVQRITSGRSVPGDPANFTRGLQ